jgi:hypothetical protein
MEQSHLQTLLEPDAVTLRPRPADSVALVGYIGEGESAATRRLYESDALERFISIPVADIVDRRSADGGADLTTGQSVVWVRRDATLLSCEPVRASRYEPGLPGDEQSLVWPRRR